MIDALRVPAGLDVGAGKQRENAVVVVQVVLVECQYEQAVVIPGPSDVGVEMLAQPCVTAVDATVMHVVLEVGNDECDGNLDVIAEADWVIDLGPGGGDAGGRIVAQGLPEMLVRTRRSETARVLRGFLEARCVN